MSLNGELREQLIALRRDLHRHPEISGDEFRTTAVVREFLQTRGVEVLETPLQTGVIAVVRGGQGSACVALRSDIDALPIEEDTQLEFASEVPGAMHACGHDFHTAALVGACLLAAEEAARRPFAGTLVFVFQPAEETGEGAKSVLETGVLQKLGVKAMVGQHNNPWLETGKIGVKPGWLMGSVDEFRITVRGVGGHAAIPQDAVDPILVGAAIVSGLQHVVSRGVSPFATVAVTVGQFHGGTARNVIPPKAVLEGTVRCLDDETRQKVQQRIHDFVEATAQSYGASAEVEYFGVLPAVDNHQKVTAIVAAAAEQVVGSDNVVDAVPVLAGEDFAVYQQTIPGCFIWSGGRSTGPGGFGWHHPQFDVDEGMILVSAQVLLQAGLDLLADF